MAGSISTTFWSFMLCVIIFGVSRAACPAGCTCSSTEITCTGLDSPPSSDDLFSTDKSTVESVSITGSPGITDIPEDYFVDLPELTNVILSSNGLTSLNVNSFKYLPKLSQIDLTGNEIACEGPLHWVKEWLAAGGDNSILGSCTEATRPAPAVTEISAFTDFIEDVVPEMLQFSPEGVIAIDEDIIGGTTATVTRTSDVSALNTKVITVLDEGTSSDDVMVSQTELVFEQNSPRADIDIQVADNADRNPRGFTITVYAESILVGKAVGTFTLTDDEMPTTVAPESSTTPPPKGMGKEEPTKVPDSQTDEKEGGGSAGKHGAMTPPATTDEPSESGNLAWIIILIIIVIIVIIVIGVFVWKRMQDRKRTTAKEPKAGYSPVKPEGEAKVYNPTTEELA